MRYVNVTTNRKASKHTVVFPDVNAESGLLHGPISVRPNAALFAIEQTETLNFHKLGAIKTENGMNIMPSLHIVNNLGRWIN